MSDFAAGLRYNAAVRRTTLRKSSLPAQVRKPRWADARPVAPPQFQPSNDFLANNEKESGLLHQLTLGAMALNQAGVAADLRPGSAPPSVMRAIMARSQAEAEGLDTDRASRRIEGGQAGRPLPEAVKMRLEASFGRDFSQVRIHTDEGAGEAAAALHALAFTIGRDIYFGRNLFAPETSGGMQLLAHEITHVVQADQGRLPSPKGEGMDVSRPSDPHEREAEAMGRQVAAEVQTGNSDGWADGNAWAGDGGWDSLVSGANLGQSLDAGGQSQEVGGESLDSGSGDVAMRQQAPTGGNSPNPGSTQATRDPLRTKLRFAGQTIDIEVRQSANGQNQTVDLSHVALPGVTLRNGHLNTDTNGNLVGGTVDADIQLGDRLQLNNVSLQVNSGGGIQATIPGITIPFGDLGSGTFTVSFGTNGASATGLLEANALHLRHGLTLNGGSIGVQVDSSGNAAGQGNLTGLLEGIGSFQLAATLSNDAITGSFALQFDPRTLATGLELLSGTLSGSYSSDACTADGSVEFQVGSWAQGTGNFHFDVQNRSLDGTAVLNQMGERNLGTFRVDSSSLQVDVQNNAVSQVQAWLMFSDPHWAGAVEGSYDLGADRFDGQGVLTLTNPLDLGGGATLNQGAAEITLVDGAPGPLTGSFAASLPFQGQPTFDARGNDIVLDLTNPQLAGTFTITTTRVLVAGPPAGVRAEVAVGATAQATVAESLVTEVTGSMPFGVHDELGEIGTGNGQFALSEEGLSGQLQFALTTNYGFPDRASVTAFLKVGTSVTATFSTEGATSATIENGGFQINNPNGAGTVDGTFSGTLDLQSHQVDGTGTASVSADWPLDAAWGNLTLTRGGSVSATVTAGVLSALEGELPFTADVNGTVPVSLQGKVSGRYADGLVNGDAEATLREPVQIPLANGDQVQLLTGGKVTAAVTDNQLQTVTLETGLSWERGGETFLDGKIANGTFDVQTGLMSFEAKATLRQPIESQTPNGWTFRIEPSSKVDATVADNALTGAKGKLKYGVDDLEGKLLKGTAQADLNTEDWTATGDGNAKTVRDLQWPDQLPGGFTATLTKGSSADGHVEASVPTELHGKLGLRLDDPEGVFASGKVDGTWDIPANTLAGTASVNLERDVELPVGQGAKLAGWGLVLGKGSNLQAAFSQDGIQSAALDAQGRAELAGAQVADLSVVGTWNPGEDGSDVDGTGTITVTEAIPWSQGGRFDTFVDPGTTATGTVENSALSSVEGTIALRAVEGGTDKVKVDAQGHIDDTGVSGSGSANVLDDIKVTERGDALLALEAGSGGNGTVETDELKTLDGTLKLRLDTEGAPLVRGDFAASYQLAEGDQASVDAEGTATLLRDVSTEAASYKFVLEEGAQLGATLAASELQKVEGSAGLRVEDGEGPLLSGELQGTYQHPQTLVDGTAEVGLVREVEVGAAGQGWQLFLLPQTGAQATIAANTLSEVSGEVKADIRDGDGSFVEITGQGTWTTEGDKKVSAEGHANVTREKSLGTNGRFAVSLLPGGEANGTVVDNTLTGLDGSVKVRIDMDGAPFVEVDVEGSWQAEGSVNGTGTAKLLTPEFKAAELGNFSMWFTEGGNAKVDVVDGSVSKLSGDLPLQIRKGGGQFLAGILTGDYDITGQTFSGAGAVSVVEEQQLASFHGDNLFLTPGSGAHVDIAANQITSIGGSVNLSLRDSAEYLKVAFEGNYDLAGGTGFTGGGGAEVTREKRLVDAGDYGFALRPGTGATAKIEQNALTEVTGKVPFRVYKTGQAFLDGNVEGRWDSATGMISGSGDVMLISDQTYGPIRLLAGSGGSGEVVNSELTRVKGALHAVMVDSHGADFIELHASGEFDAVNNDIVELTGTAKTLQPWQPFSGLVIKDVVGTGKITHNHIDSVEGSGTMEIAALHATGTLTGGWRNEGGNDTYWGDASLQINMPMGGNGKRGITGAGISASLHEDKSFNVHGDITYQLTEKIGGTLGIDMDQEMDPIISGTLHATGTLVEGRDLFKMETDIVPGNFVMAGPVPISYGVKGAMGASLDPLTYTATAGISNFHPLDANVPDFEAEMALNGGARFWAELAPYVGVGVTVSAIELALMAGVEGQVKLEVPLELGLTGKLKGEGGEKFTGELGVGAKVAPSLTVAAVPFVEGTILGMGLSRHRFESARLSHTFADLFTMEWNKTYTFGDEQKTTEGGAQQKVTSGGTATPTEEFKTQGTAPPSMGGNSQAPAPGGEGPQIAGADLGGEKGGGAMDGMSKITGAIDTITTLADGVDGMTTIFNTLGRGAINPMAMAVDIVFNWDKLATAARKVAAAVQKVADLLAPYLPGWWATLWDIIQKGKQALINAAGLVLDGAKWVANKAWDGVKWVGSGIGSLASSAWDHTLGALF